MRAFFGIGSLGILWLSHKRIPSTITTSWSATGRGKDYGDERGMFVGNPSALVSGKSCISPESGEVQGQKETQREGAY